MDALHLKPAIAIGASSGIGAAIATYLPEVGRSVAVTYADNAAQAEELVNNAGCAVRKPWVESSDG